MIDYVALAAQRNAERGIDESAAAQSRAKIESHIVANRRKRYKKYFESHKEEIKESHKKRNELHKQRMLEDPIYAENYTNHKKELYHAKMAIPENREKRNKKHREYYAKNVEKMRKQRVDQYWKDPVHSRNVHKQWCKNNHEKISEQRRKNYLKHKEERDRRSKKYRAENREYLNLKDRCKERIKRNPQMYASITFYDVVKAECELLKMNFNPSEQELNFWKIYDEKRNIIPAH